MKKIVCDSSSLISMSDNCVLWLLPEFGVEFVVPEEVKREIVDRPMKEVRFQFKALRLSRAITNGSIKVVTDSGVAKRAKEIVRLANSLFKYGRHNVSILHGGEAESIALMQKQGIQTLLVDERTTRLLIEDRVALRKYIERRTGFNLKLNKQIAGQLEDEVGGVDVIRSSELLAWAYENGLMEKFGRDRNVLHASLYGLKYSGCAISNEEIEDYMKLLA
ncbi:MAG: hypothetical protein KAW41_02590 [Candidatus Diapherotrites archaeon]|nr:hypothetical protein [Candidatus Diapherotrites archaeon]